MNAQKYYIGVKPAYYPKLFLKHVVFEDFIFVQGTMQFCILIRTKKSIWHCSVSKIFRSFTLLLKRKLQHVGHTVDCSVGQCMGRPESIMLQNLPIMLFAF